LSKPEHSPYTVTFSLAVLCLFSGILHGAVAYSGPFTLDNRDPVISFPQANTIDTLYTGQTLCLSFQRNETHLRRSELQLYDADENLLARYIFEGADSLLNCTIPNLPRQNACLVLELVDDYGNASSIFIDDNFQIVPDRPLPPAGLCINASDGIYHLTWQAAHMISGAEHQVDYYLVCKSTSPDPDDLRAYRVIGITTGTSFTEITPRIPRFAYYRIVAGKLGSLTGGTSQK